MTLKMFGAVAATALALFATAAKADNPSYTIWADLWYYWPESTDKAVANRHAEADCYPQYRHKAPAKGKTASIRHPYVCK